ncbi:triose-phosphate isomerase [Malacoplasma penetrans]|uniref:Triosephosphate isomerase n=1 Tax=Malacoplasma penetrans (strain HF-2) TaxID=272633 RepID=TPIS_MALP2|nr:triose-phosphate isomerase [Malacoplasma penetrans]Q8EW34.1 RecName: Full=Triosephosphate isomerase; Short=TIM; Short=TPI; AltName: Full=Triose-phosphate isomerase [Malacoplasma penetrans HF-2]RXY96374.1 triose-phosphate isomerase [Malacoplasma penetrans]BAC44162.1 triose phosphate isomerase [Malacoplasma penetrans HF-2]
MKKLIIANWKMFKTLNDIKTFKEEFDKNIKNVKVNADYSVGVPSIYLNQAKEILKGIKVIAQDAHFKNEGAYTGNISWSQLKDCGIDGSIIGHSERRQMFNETDETVNLKTISLVENNMQAVVCVGETLEEYEANKSFDVVWNQTKKALANVSEAQLKNVVIAYEPVWAIGTGKVPTGKEVDDLIQKVRDELSKLYSKQAVESLVVLYGGSVNDKNAEEFFKQKNINGALVGSFCLKAENFVKLIELGGN